MKHNQELLSRRDFARTAAFATGTLSAGDVVGASSPAADIKIGLYSITYLGVWYRGGALRLEQVIQRAKDFGYQGMEIDGKRPHGNPLDMPRIRCRQLRRLAEDNGIEIYAVAANNDFSSPIPEHRESQLVYVRELIRMTSELEANLLRMFFAWPGVTLLPQGGGSYEVARAAWQEVHKSFSEAQIWDWCRASMAEAAYYAGEHGVTLALQNHAPVVKSYRDCLRMIREVGSPHLKMCFDARLERGLDPGAIQRATVEVGQLQVLSHFGGEFSEGPNGIQVKGGGSEVDLAEVRGLVETGYRGYLGYELCHPLPVVQGQTVGLDFVDECARLAAEYMRGLISKARNEGPAPTL